MTFHTTLAAGICLAAASTASAQSLPFESTYTYGVLNYSPSVVSRRTNSITTIMGGQEYMFGNTMVFGDLTFDKISFTGLRGRAINREYSALELGAAQNFSDFQIGFEYRYASSTFFGNTRREDRTTLFASYDADQYGAMFTASKVRDSDLIRGTLGGHFNINDQFSVAALGAWNESNGVVRGMIAFSYENGPLDASLFTSFDSNRPNDDQPGMRIEYDVTDAIGVGLRYEPDIGNGSFTELSARYDINDSMSVVAAYGKDFSSSSNGEDIGFALVYETGQSGRYDRVLTDTVAQNQAALQHQRELFIRD